MLDLFNKQYKDPSQIIMEYELFLFFNQLGDIFYAAYLQRICFFPDFSHGQFQPTRQLSLIPYQLGRPSHTSSKACEVVATAVLCANLCIHELTDIEDFLVLPWAQMAGATLGLELAISRR